MRKQFVLFLLRWLLNSFGLWLAARLLASQFDAGEATTATFLTAGLVLSVANTLLRPIIIILSLPAILVTLGLFMLVVNGLMVYLALTLVPNVEINFVGAIIAGMIVSLINYIISGIMELRDQPKGHSFS